MSFSGIFLFADAVFALALSARALYLIARDSDPKGYATAFGGFSILFAVSVASLSLPDAIAFRVAATTVHSGSWSLFAAFFVAVGFLRADLRIDAGESRWIAVAFAACAAASAIGWAAVASVARAA